jgi:putative SOS response-associated peptidase YedK
MWKAGKGGKTPFLIRRKDKEPFAMAGLRESWRSEDGASPESCTIIVTDANDLVRSIHDRMPVIIDGEDCDGWLDPDNKDTDALLQMLAPINPEQWTMHQVSRQVNSPRNEGPALLEIAEQADA